MGACTSVDSLDRPFELASGGGIATLPPIAARPLHVDDLLRLLRRVCGGVHFASGRHYVGYLEPTGMYELHMVSLSFGITRGLLAASRTQVKRIRNSLLGIRRDEEMLLLTVWTAGSDPH